MTPADPRPDDAPPLTEQSLALYEHVVYGCKVGNDPDEWAFHANRVWRQCEAIERAARADAEARLVEVLELLVYSDVPQRIVDRAHDIAALAPRGGGE